MYARFSGQKKRGASVLAALVLIAILGVAAAVMQYASHSSAVALAPQSQTAATAATEPSAATTNDNTSGASQNTQNQNTCPMAGTADKTATSQNGNGTDASCLQGQVHIINLSGANPDDKTVNCLVQSTDPKTKGQCVKNTQETNQVCQTIAQQNKCVVEYCPPAGTFSGASSGGCIVVQSCTPGSGTCSDGKSLADWTSYLNNPGNSVAAIAYATAQNQYTPVIPSNGQLNGAQYIEQALNQAPSPNATIGDATNGSMASQVLSQLNQWDPSGYSYSTAESAIQNQTSPTCTSASCTIGAQLNSNLTNTSGSPAVTTPTAPSGLSSGPCLYGASYNNVCNPAPSNTPAGGTAPGPGGTCPTTGQTVGANGLCSGAAPAPAPAAQQPVTNNYYTGTPNAAANNTNGLNCGIGVGLGSLSGTGGTGLGYSCIPGSGSGGSSSGLNNLLEMTMMAKLIQGMVNSGNTSVPPGNQTQYSAGTCNTQYICSGTEVYYQQSTCVQTPYQQCANGCDPGGASCAAASQYGTGTNGVACTAPVVQPSSASCTSGTWMPISANGCSDTSWQCVSSNQSTPTNTTGNSPVGNGTFTVTIGDNGNPLTANVHFSSGVACNDAFEVTWGDGDQPNVMTYAPPANGATCAASTQTNNIPHTYATAGTYTVTLAQGPSLTQTSTQQVTVGAAATSTTATNPTNTTTTSTTTTTTSTTPTASLTCAQPIVDVGKSVTLGFQCANSATASGSGFLTGGNLSGTTSASISTPPSGTNTATYTLTCTGSTGTTAGAQCSVQINQPSIVMVANPSTVSSGQSTSIGWVTTGMQSCAITDSPDTSGFDAANASNTSSSGAAVLSNVTGTVTATLTCQTLGGQTKTATALVQVGSSPTTTTTNAPITISSSADGSSTSHGAAASIKWSSTNPPSGSVISLWLVNEQAQTASALIASNQPTTGSYTWTIPAVGSSCTSGSAIVCASDLVAGDSYAVEAVLYSPSNAYIGNGIAPASPVQPTYGASAVGGTFTISQ